MEIRQLALEDTYRELNNIVGVVAVTADGPGGLCIEHKDARSDIEEFLTGTTWEIIDADDLAGQYPRVYVAPDDQPDCRRGGG
jgi:hypothetical protein